MTRPRTTKRTKTRQPTRLELLKGRVIGWRSVDDYGCKIEMAAGIWRHLIATDAEFISFNFERAAKLRRQGRRTVWLCALVSKVLSEPALKRIGTPWLDEALVWEGLDRLLNVSEPLP